MTDIFRSQLLSLKQTMGNKKGKVAKAVDYMMDHSDSDEGKSGDDSFENIDDESAEQLTKFIGAEDPSQLVDFELVNLLKFGYDLQ